MSNLKQSIADISTQLKEELSRARTIDDAEKIRVQFLGKKGSISLLNKQLKDLSLEEKREVAPLIQQLRNDAEEKITTLIDTLNQQRINARAQQKKHFDVTAYKHPNRHGHLHPYTRITEEIENIFMSMGYDVLDGQEAESDYYNFSALNIPEDHPARDMYDTFWLNVPHMLMRTHTSPVQIHTMEKRTPPIAAVIPGRCFRHEATDATHDFMFMQCEGFLIDENITLSHLFATAQQFLQALFNKQHLDIRIRPGFFPFVEPGVEIDMQCPFCKKGCSICKKSRWIEVFPGGLIHPNVLRAGGIDPEKYSGFAFGFGLTRLAMIKYGIEDIRLLHSGKLKFLSHF